MLKERAKVVAYWVWTTDLVLTALAFLLAWWIRSQLGLRLAPSIFPTELYPLSRYLGLLPLVLAIWTFLLVAREAYTSRRTVALSHEVWQVVQVVGAGTLTRAAAGWLLRLDFVSRPFLILFGTIDLALLVGEKVALRLFARHVRRRGYNYRTLLIVGINPRSEEVARIIQLHPHWGLKLLGFVAPNGDFPEQVVGLPVLGSAAVLPNLCRWSVHMAESQLKQTWKQKIEAFRPRTTKLNKEFGEVVIDKVTISQAIGGARDVRCLVTDISYLDPQEGIRFRGKTIPETFAALKDHVVPGCEMPTGESFFYFLLTGDVPSKQQAAEVEADWKSREQVPAYVYDVLRALPRDTHPMTMFSAAILSMQRDSVFAKRYGEGTLKKNDMWDPMNEDSMTLLARLPTIAAYFYRMKYKGDTIIPADPKLDWGGNFAHMMGQVKPYDDVARMYFILHSDHESGNTEWQTHPMLILPSPLTATERNLTHVHTAFWDEVREYVRLGGLVYISLCADAAIPEMAGLFGASLADHGSAADVDLTFVEQFGDIAPGTVLSTIRPMLRIHVTGMPQSM